MKARVISIVALFAVGCEEVPRMYSTRAATGQVIFTEDFDSGELGPHWQPSGEGAEVKGGMLVVTGLQNHPVWLDLPLPDDVRVEFDAWATTEEGDIKVELFGDGKSFATTASYTATGYVVIFGGWNNTLNALVRQNEHGRDRVTTSEPKVQPDKRYHFVITRTGGDLLWEVNGQEIASMEDDEPLSGPGNDRFAFSGWEAQTHFDNLVIEAL